MRGGGTHRRIRTPSGGAPAPPRWEPALGTSGGGGPMARVQRRRWRGWAALLAAPPPCPALHARSYHPPRLDFHQQPSSAPLRASVPHGRRARARDEDSASVFSTVHLRSHPQYICAPTRQRRGIAFEKKKLSVAQKESLCWETDENSLI